MGKRLTRQEWVDKLNKVHNNKYDYSLANEIKDSFKIKIICPEHGVFSQIVNAHHIGKQGCPECGKIRTINTHRFDIQKLIKKIESKNSKEFADNLDFTESCYTQIHEKINVRCIKHNNKFNIVPTSLVRGICCKLCTKEAAILKHSQKQLPNFLNLCKKVHGDTYNYNLVKYINSNTPVVIVCPIHGEFVQKPGIHLMGSGCAACGISQGESTIAVFLKENKIEHIHQYKVKINNSNHWFDFYISEKNIIIEFNGMQHYFPIKYFGGKRTFIETQKRDKLKQQYCKENNIKLLTIHYKYKNNLPNILSKELLT